MYPTNHTEHIRAVAFAATRTGNDKTRVTAGTGTAIAVERRPDDIVLARVSGEVDTLATPALRDCVDYHLRPGNRFVLDLEDVGFFGVAGLSVLLDTERRADREHLAWGLVASCRPVVRPLTVTGLAGRLPTYESIGDAVVALSPALAVPN